MKFKIAYIVLLLLYVNSFAAQSADFKERYYTQRLDHFNFVTYDRGTFKQRVLINDTWWDTGKGPIFFYTGNEGDIEQFWYNTGFVFDIAPQFKALVIFAEHRFYGKSLPFGVRSFDRPYVGLLTVEQALADYALLLTKIKEELKAENCPVISFGGSYGGMLSAYFRFKYPNIIDGAIAASAPIYQTAGLTSSTGFFEVVTKDFKEASANCESLIRSAFSLISQWATKGSSGLQKISQTFRLCDDLKNNSDYDHFLRWIRTAFTNSAMMDYPYKTNFTGSYPPYPVKEMCHMMEKAKTSIDGLSDACALTYNSTGKRTCFDIWTDYIYCSDQTGCGTGLDSKAWDFQVCTEIDIPAESTGVTDMFPKLPFTSKMKEDYCQKTWKVKPRSDWLGIQMWGKNIKSASNIVFSNGDLDPWNQGGVLTNISDSVISVWIEGGAHHLDLRGQNPADPQSVIDARSVEIKNIEKWIQEARQKSHSVY